MLGFNVVCFFMAHLSIGVVRSEPKFDTTHSKISVREGQTAVLPCSVKDIKSYKVIWITPSGTSHTFGNNGQRIRVTQPSTDHWYLNINGVKFSDQGEYICEITTQPAQRKSVKLTVVAAPQIVGTTKTVPITFKMGDTLKLHCDAKGTPTPMITWFFRSQSKPSGKGKIGQGKEYLKVNVGHSNAGLYECQASNGVGTTASRSFDVLISFPPMVSTPVDRSSQSQGKTAHLKCQVSAYPPPVVTWKKDGTIIVSRAPKYKIDVRDDGGNNSTVTLRIKDLKPQDFGTYTCGSQNYLGDDESSVELIDKDKNNKNGGGSSSHRFAVPWIIGIVLLTILTSMA